MNNTENGVSYGRIVVVRYRDSYEAEEVIDHLRIQLEAGLPVIVDSVSELRISESYFAGMRRGLVVVKGVSSYTFHVRRACCFAFLHESPEVLQDEVLSMIPHPSPVSC